MSKTNTRPAKTVKGLIPVTATVLLQAAIQQAYAAPCSTDTPTSLSPNSETCTASGTTYSSYTSSPVVIIGSNSNLTLLDNTTITSGGGPTYAINLSNGTNNSLFAENLNINIDRQTIYWYGISVSGNNAAKINQNLNITSIASVSSPTRGIETINKDARLEVYGDYTFTADGGDGVFNNGGNIDLYKTTTIKTNRAYSGISTSGPDSKTTFHGDASFDAFAFAILANNGANIKLLSNATAITSGGYQSISVAGGSNLDIQKSLSVTSAGNHSIENRNSTITINNVSQANSGSAGHSFLNQSGSDSITTIGPISNATSAGNFIRTAGGTTNIGPGSFTSDKTSILVNTASNTSSNINIGALELKNNNEESVTLNGSGNNTIKFNGSTLTSANSTITADAAYNGSSNIALNSATLNHQNPTFIDTSASTGEINVTTDNTHLNGTTTSGSSTLNLVLKNSSWLLNDPTANQASVTRLDLDSQSTLGLSAKASPYDFFFSGNVNNSGLIKISNNAVIGNTINITGDYIGNSGKIDFNIELNKDDSATDKLIIAGNASGSTSLHFKNTNGKGSTTDKGILVIETTSSTPQAFYLPGGYVSAGVYEYSLSMRNENAQDNWYLGAALMPQPPKPQPQPPLPPIDPRDLPTPTPEEYIYSPNPGALIALQQAGNTLFNSQLEDREGASTQWLTSDGQYNVWLRAYGSSNQYNALYKQLHTEGRSMATQLGVGLVTLGDKEQFNFGLLAGYGRFSSDTHSRITQRKATSELHGYSVGAYATWYKDPSNKQGFYADSWLLWNHFDNKLKLADGDKYKFKSRGVTASVEVGSHYRLMEGETINWWLQPQAQVIFEGVKAHKRRDAFGVAAKSGKHNVLTRLGAKTYLEVPVAISEHTQYRPYFELNWLHNTNPHSVVISDSTYSAQGSRNLGEVKVGLEGNFAENGLIWADAGYISGSHQNRTVQGTLGVKFNF